MIRHFRPSLAVAVMTAAIAIIIAPGANGQPGPPLVYETVTVSKNTGDCQTEGGLCAEFKVSYPKITRAGGDAARDAINARIMKKILETLDQDNPAGTIESKMDKFLGEYQAFLKEGPEYATPWGTELVVAVVFNQSGLASISYSISGFTGGAHGFYNTDYETHDVNTGRVIPLSDLLAPGAKARLDAIADRKFRAQKDLAPTASLEEAGWTFENNKVSLNQNYYLAAAGPHFYFNPYEVGPWVVGDTDLLLPFAEIEPLLKKDGPLSALLSDPASRVPDLCAPAREDVVFSCAIEGKKAKVLSLCAPRPEAGGPRYLYYRFGTTDAVELAFPGEDAPVAPGEAFRFNWDSSGSVRLEFDNNGHTYRVFQDGSSRGVEVVAPGGKKTVTLPCREPSRGDLKDLGPMFEKK